MWDSYLLKHQKPIVLAINYPQTALVRLQWVCGLFVFSLLDLQFVVTYSRKLFISLDASIGRK